MKTLSRYTIIMLAALSAACSSTTASEDPDETAMQPEASVPVMTTMNEPMMSETEKSQTETPAEAAPVTSTANPFWIMNGTTGLYKADGSWLRVHSSADPIEVFETAGGMARIHQSEDHWVKLERLTDQKPAMMPKIERLPPRYDNRVDPSIVTGQ